MAIDRIGAAPGVSSATAGGVGDGWVASDGGGGERESLAETESRLRKEIEKADEAAISENAPEGRKDASRRAQAARDQLARIEARRKEEAPEADAGSVGSVFDASA